MSISYGDLVLYILISLLLIFLSLMTVFSGSRKVANYAAFLFSSILSTFFFFNGDGELFFYLIIITIFISTSIFVFNSTTIFPKLKNDMVLKNIITFVLSITAISIICLVIVDQLDDVFWDKLEGFKLINSNSQKRSNHISLFGYCLLIISGVVFLTIENLRRDN